MTLGVGSPFGSSRDGSGVSFPGPTSRGKLLVYERHQSGLVALEDRCSAPVPAHESHRRWPRWRWWLVWRPASLPGADAADNTCVGQGEYKRIHGGMTIQKLVEVLDGQTPFAESAGANNKQRIRWYAACEDWQPDKDVVVRYHQPVVGRRTVTKKGLDVYVAP